MRESDTPRGGAGRHRLAASPAKRHRKADRPSRATTPVTRHRRPWYASISAGRYAVGAATAAIVGLNLAVLGASTHPATTKVSVATPVRDNVVTPTADDTDRLGDRADRSLTRDQPSPVPSSAAPTTPAAPSPPPPPPAPPKPAAWVSPVVNYAFTSGFGIRWGTMHKGVDLANATGTPVRAAGAGTVVQAGWTDNGFGNWVVIDHGGGLLTLYGHNSRVIVSVGQHVTPGQQISLMGSTGNSTGPHCHFEVHVGGMWNEVDPIPWMKAHGVRIA